MVLSPSFIWMTTPSSAAVMFSRMGPLGFALSLHPIIERIKEVPGLLINAWYLDDVTLCGSVWDLRTALSIIEAKGPSRGLSLKRSRSLLHVPADASLTSNCLPADIPVTSGGFDLLGSPVRSSASLLALSSQEDREVAGGSG